MGAPMRYALAVASFLACWSGGAFGAEMPKDLWGAWCDPPPPPPQSSGVLVKCSNQPDSLENGTWENGSWEDTWVISRKGTALDDIFCQPLRVQARGYLTWIIKVRCGNDVSTTLFTRKGKYLYTKDLP